MRGFLFFLVVIMVPFASAHQPQEGTLRVTFGPYLHRTYVPPSYDVTMSTNLGLGILVEADIDNNGGVEMGLFYMEKSYHQNYHGTEIVEAIKRIHIPIGYRHWWNDRISTGVGFYSSYSIGEPRPMDTPLGPPDFNSAARRATKYGFDLSMIWDFFTVAEYALVLDARLSLALDSKSGEHSSHYGLMCGLKFPL